MSVGHDMSQCVVQPEFSVDNMSSKRCRVRPISPEGKSAYNCRICLLDFED